MKRRNQELFECAWGASDFRQGMITLGREFISPNETFPSCADDLLAEAADHSTEVDLAHYAIVQGALPRLSNSSLAQHRWLAKEWSSLLGMGPQKPPEPAHARGAAVALDARELAAQVSDMVADAVMSKLAAAGLTAENIKKLRNLGEAPPLGAAGGGSQEAGGADAPPSEPASVRGETPPPTAGEGSPQAARRPILLDKDRGSLETPPPPLAAEDLDLLGPSAPHYSPSPTQFSRQLKRAAPHEATTQEETAPPNQKKRARRSEVGCEKDQLLTESGMGQPNHLQALHLSPPASKLPGYAAENTLVENVLHRDRDRDGLLQDNIRCAIQKLLRNPAACEKSRSQMEAILLVMRRQQDGLITMRTGGGKSMLWLIPPLLDPGARFIVVCPFTVLLNQQRELAQRQGLRATEYGAEGIPQDTQILFVQVEHVGCQKFRR